jgi:hypothetical protein
MARFAVIENNEVVNVILAEAGFVLAGVEMVEVSDESMVSAGWAYQSGEFVAHPEPERPAGPTAPSGTLPVTEV